MTCDVRTYPSALPLSVTAAARRTRKALRVEVCSEDVLNAAGRLRRPAVLCFASARNPGGGVHAGASGQEEYLCRAQSELLAALHTPAAQSFYDHHRRHCGPLNSDWCVYVAGTPAVVMCAAPNAREAALYRVSDESIALAFRRRTRRVLDVCAVEGHRNVVLGAWGCGAFGNDPQMVARAFGEAIDAREHNFDHIVFAIYDSAHRRAFQHLER